MKPLRFLLGLPVLYILAISSTTTFVSCKKTVTIYDTTIKIEHDTTIKPVHDTTLITDSVYDLSSGLVAYYNFTNGTLKDSSGLSNNIIFNSATLAPDRFGRSNNAYSFNGSGSYMQVSNSLFLDPNNITMFAIVKVNGYYAGPCHANNILSKGYPDDISGFYTMRFTDTSTGCNSAPNTSVEIFAGGFGDNVPQGAATGATSGSTYVETNQWYNLVFTYEGGYAKFFVNGQLTDIRKRAVAFTPNGHDMFIGRHEDPSYPYFFNGVIDEIRIYNRALSNAEITRLNKLTE